MKLEKGASCALFDVVDSELRYLVNEYDPDIGRCPSKRRLQGKETALSIINKWCVTQPHIDTFVNLSEIRACDIELSKNELSYCIGLIKKEIIKLDSPCGYRFRKSLEALLQKLKEEL